uniref:Prolyl 4-hydroxylase alpha subunit Fe(2+) 2OG dioxygenase domain-containing protein n=1 Tax=Chlamydomonas euryale TaxID=1486919 RepID=A0A7R9YW01_9CHLO|mmetsp:Transcript_2887/g.7757  ORF Transcript_2887/g.7757 Transcript_2887/m.7757 type:complete len:294 (+) Transcript_2887:169-1050(+)
MLLGAGEAFGVGPGQQLSPDDNTNCKPESTLKRVVLHPIVVALLLYSFLNMFFPPPLYTNAPDDTLYTWHEDYLDERTFNEIRTELVNGSLAHVPNNLNPKNFGPTSGVLLSFNLEGLEVARSIPRYAPIVRFVDAIPRVDGANAFVVNLLRASPSAGPGSAARRKTARKAAGEHIDDTLRQFLRQEAFWSRSNFIAHRTTVGYLQVPPDMQGGLLKMTAYVTDDQVAILPKENALVTFRGDTLHGVQSFRSDSGLARVSIVVEQYKVKPERYARVATFHTSEPGLPYSRTYQ